MKNRRLGERLSLRLSPEDLEALDNWGEARGCKSRSEMIRAVLRTLRKDASTDSTKEI
ncbi:ribbon-helix-helix domain-containing protein [Roseococcus pinisoli]|uniref:Ribbon-helix-helix protein, CopG family n=1 Tax=Roseococcus pinisoli TaxID=2835040 RepID=A0ABS5QF18_9PROT|nr:ribbon-helix-helix protein, CopG family [Roseococcus pinisoli]